MNLVQFESLDNKPCFINPDLVFAVRPDWYPDRPACRVYSGAATGNDPIFVIGSLEEVVGKLQSAKRGEA